MHVHVISAVFLFQLSITGVLTFPLFHSSSHACIVPSNSEWVQYSGHRIQYETILAFPGRDPTSWLHWLGPKWTNDSIIITECRYGQIVNEASFRIQLTTYEDHEDKDKDKNNSSNESKNRRHKLPDIGHILNFQFPWNTSLCTDGGSHCFRLARRSRYSKRRVPLFLPRTIVGGLYVGCENCNDNNQLPAMQEKNDDSDDIINDNDNAAVERSVVQQTTGSHDGDNDTCFWNPILPLIVDSPVRNAWSRLVPSRKNIQTAHRIPLMYTPDIMDRRYPRSSAWANHVNPFEAYTGPDPRRLRDKLVDKTILVGTMRFSQHR